MNSSFWLNLLIVSTILGGIVGYNIGLGKTGGQPGIGGSPGNVIESPTPDVTEPTETLEPIEEEQLEEEQTEITPTISPTP